jgi:preprotein translocase subunit Sss1
VKIYKPQWNEYDKPTVRCPHVEGRKIGSSECKVCEHLSQWIDRQYETLIECKHPDAIEHNNIIKAHHAVAEYLAHEATGGKA